MLYQLSYFRLFFATEVCFSIAGAKVELFFELPKLFRDFFERTWNSFVYEKNGKLVDILMK